MSGVQNLNILVVNDVDIAAMLEARHTAVSRDMADTRIKPILPLVDVTLFTNPMQSVRYEFFANYTNVLGGGYGLQLWDVKQGDLLYRAGVNTVTPHADITVSNTVCGFFNGQNFAEPFFGDDKMRRLQTAGFSLLTPVTTVLRNSNYVGFVCGRYSFIGGYAFTTGLRISDWHTPAEFVSLADVISSWWEKKDKLDVLPMFKEKSFFGRRYWARA